MFLLVGILSLLVADTPTEAGNLFSQGRYPEAATSYSALLQRNPDDPALLHGMGQTLRAMRQSRQAMPYLLHEVQVVPKDRQAARALAAAMQEANEFSQGSLRFLESLAQADPGGGEIWYRRGLLLYQNGYYGGALEDLNKALAAQMPEDRDAAELIRGICLVEAGRYEDAEPVVRALMSRAENAKNLDLLLAYTRVLYETARYEQAMELADQAVAIDGENASAHFWRARVLHQQDQLNEAASDAERARELSPGSPAPRNLLIRIYQRLGRADEAAVEAEWVRQHQPSSGRQ